MLWVAMLLIFAVPTSPSNLLDTEEQSVKRMLAKGLRFGFCCSVSQSQHTDHSGWLWDITLSPSASFSIQSNTTCLYALHGLRVSECYKDQVLLSITFVFNFNQMLVWSVLFKEVHSLFESSYFSVNGWGLSIIPGSCSWATWFLRQHGNEVQWI